VIIVGIFIAGYYLGFTREYCGTDVNCFNEKKNTCSPVEVYSSKENNVYYYKLNPTLRNRCKLLIKFEKAQEGTSPEHIALLEGKSMMCILPKQKMQTLSILEMNEIMPYCSGPLKEGIYELIVKRMYELIITNLGEITEEAEKIMKV
jgi:hypothetical protein